jgi:hypothetical protein
LNASNINFFIEGELSSNLLMTCDKVAVVVLETASEMQKLGAGTGSELSRRSSVSDKRFRAECRANKPT